MKNLILMQGVPGSGKSTVAHELRRAHSEGVVEIISTDDYWYSGTQHVYNFNPALLGEAHKWNQQRCLKLMEAGATTIIIDNTNITKNRVIPYVGLAMVFDYSVTVVRVDPGLDVALARNRLRTEDRQVPEEVVRNMYAAMEPLLPLTEPKADR